MAGTITHKWDGTILTITSDSGTSSADLKGAKGDDGARGAVGACPTLTVNGKIGDVVLTAADIGAMTQAEASGLYNRIIGRGAYTGDINDYTALTGNCVYWIGEGTGTKNLPWNEYGYMTVFDNGGGYLQEITYINGSRCKRLCFDGGSGLNWTEWEWENPPLYSGTEYRTTEKYFNSPVYTKVIDCGNSTNGKHIQTYINNVIRYAGKLGNLPIPYLAADGFNGQFAAWFEINDGYAVLNTKGFGENPTFLQLWYLK